MYSIVQDKREKALRRVDASTFLDEPKKVWNCGKCNAENDEWALNLLWVTQNDNVPKWVQGECANCKKIEREKEDAAKVKRQKAFRLKLAEELIANSELPQEFRRGSQELKIRKGAEEIFEIMNKKGTFKFGAPWIMIQGDNNTGKSVLLGNTIMKCAMAGIPSYYFNECLFFREVKGSFEEESVITETKLMSRLKECDVLFWDEFLFFNYTKKEWIYERAYAIIEYAAETGKVIIFATNVEAVESRCSKRIRARLRRRQTRFLKMRNVPFY